MLLLSTLLFKHKPECMLKIPVHYTCEGVYWSRKILVFISGSFLMLFEVQFYFF